MELSFVGLAVFSVLFLTGWSLGSGTLIGLMVSLPFASTAFVRLPWLGGSTPLIYTLFAVLLVMNVFFRRKNIDALRIVFHRHRSAWVVACLMLLAIAATILLPRIFAGETVGLLPVNTNYLEFPLQPSSKNVTQAGYFLLGILTYFAVSVMLLEKPRQPLIFTAFAAFCIAHLACGLIDVVAKRAGESDVFALIRTANYAMLSEATVAGFPRLTGATPEASTFAMVGLACLGFTFAYWRETGSRAAIWMTVINLVLLLLSTSSTAYVGLGILSAPVAWRIAKSVKRKERIAPLDWNALLFGILAVSISLAVFLTSGQSSDLFDLVRVTTIEKANTYSAADRLRMNAVSIHNLLDTYGLGVGLGSSRASGWVIAVLAQLGVAGAVLLSVLVFVLFRGMNGITRTNENAELVAVGNAVCASAIAWLVGVSISAGSADPGIEFFVALAVVSSWRRFAQSVDRVETSCMENA